MTKVNETIQLIKRKEKNGYISVYTDDGWVLEHRFVVESFIGRKLTKEEVVHHCDENKSNNLLQNLVVFKNQREHSSWHNKMKKFGYITNPMKRFLENRWNEYKIEVNA